MKPRTAIGLALTAIGLGITGYGLVSAVLEFGSMYASATTDALADPAPGGEQAISSHMLRDVAIGACGLLPLTIGTALLGMGFLGVIIRMIERSQGNAAPPAPGQPPKR